MKVYSVRIVVLASLVALLFVPGCLDYPDKMPNPDSIVDVVDDTADDVATDTDDVDEDTGTEDTAGDTGDLDVTEDTGDTVDPDIVNQDADTR